MSQASLYKIEFYVPESHLEQVKSAMFAAGAGRAGEYDSCAWQTLGQGQFRGLEGSSPYLGQSG
ncbi:MAG: NGG1p interacting factor NIF3, partial [Gammaproteobacteria bacterium]